MKYKLNFIFIFLWITDIHGKNGMVHAPNPL